MKPKASSLWTRPHSIISSSDPSELASIPKDEYGDFFDETDDELLEFFDSRDSPSASSSKLGSSILHSETPSPSTRPSKSYPLGHTARTSDDDDDEIFMPSSHRMISYPKTPSRSRSVVTPGPISGKKLSSSRRAYTMDQFSEKQAVSYQMVMSTPSKGKLNLGTPNSRASAIRESFHELGLGDDGENSPTSPIVPRRLFLGSSPSGSGHNPSDSDEDMDEDSTILTDTDSPSGGWSMLSAISPLDSTSSLDSGWSIPSASSFISTSSANKRRNGGCPPFSSSPKHRKLGNQDITVSDDASCLQAIGKTTYQPSLSTTLPKLRGPSTMENIPSSSSPVENFLCGAIGIDLIPAVIAHDTCIQTLMDNAEISWGVQYELARGVSVGLWTWSDVEQKINVMKGPSPVIAHKVQSIMLDKPLKGFHDLSVWEELEREQAAILENRERGLGLMGEWYGQLNWYGGQIQQLARLVRFENGYKIHLQPMEKRRSYRLARFLGSRRILQLRIPDELVLKENKEVKEYLLQKFILCGRVFVPLFSKESCVYLVETNQDYQRQPSVTCGDQHRRSFADIIQWHNRLDLNRDQPISKWSTRLALAFSTSIPALLFKEENIHHIDDIYTADWVGKGKAPAEKTTTDGCGFINESALKAIAVFLGLPSRCTAVQARIMGGKGLWILHPSDKDTEPKIWIRKSQNKIIYHYPLHRAHLILDLVSISRPSNSINLSRQSIINLSHNGVSDDVLQDLLIQGLTDGVEPLMKWDGPYAMQNLWYVINQLGCVTRVRLQRQVAGLGRILGLQGREWGHEDVGLEIHGVDPIGELQIPDHTGRNQVTGEPVGINEKVLELIQSGFRPDELKRLRKGIRCIVKQAITSIIEKYMIPLPQSMSGFIVPDPHGVLEEGEIYYRSSQPLKNPDTQTFFHLLTGPALLGRYPVRLPSDVQKLTAVDRPELFDYFDVLIVSTKGRFSFASILSGGDEVFIILEQSIVQLFESKVLTKMPYNLIEDNFEGQVETVTAFAERAATMSSHDAQKAFQEVLLLNINDSKVGLYSNFHDFAVWKYGYDHPHSIRLAYIFNTVLDSSKTGLRLKPGIFEKDRKLFSGEVLIGQDAPPSKGRKTFILNSLHKAGKLTGDNLLRNFDSLPESSDTKDAHLQHPYTHASNHALAVFKREGNNRMLTDEISRIRELVDRAYAAFQEAVDRTKAFSEQKKKQKKKKKAKSDFMSLAIQIYDQEVEGVFLIQNVREIKASYAYHVSLQFAFSVAFRDLCLIKAQASPGGIVPTIRMFDEAKSIPSTYVRVLGRIVADHS